jgi:hypothetical protein
VEFGESWRKYYCSARTEVESNIEKIKGKRLSDGGFNALCVTKFYFKNDIFLIWDPG